MNPSPGQDVVTILQSLVRIPSVNPLAHPAPGQGGEKRCAEAVASYLSALGALDVSLPEVLPLVILRGSGETTAALAREIAISSGVKVARREAAERATAAVPKSEVR